MPQGGVGLALSTTIATAISFFPWATSWAIALRSAQMVSPKLAFSTLQPLMMVPSSQQIAAPTLKLEYFACARARTLSAAANNASQSMVALMGGLYFAP